jgi:hydrogenase large subunit
MARIVVDPVTRIEGHLRIEAEVNAGAVTCIRSIPRRCRST